MPVADEDVVLGINISTGLTENVTIPATDMSIRPIVRHPELGLITLIQPVSYTHLTLPTILRV